MKAIFYFLLICIICFINPVVKAQSKTNTTSYANTALSNLTSPTSINQSLLVDKGNSHNIGSATKGWKNIYLDSALYIGGSRVLAIKTGTGLNNTAVGSNAMNANTAGYSNTAVGYRTLYFNTTGLGNAANGYQTLYFNTEGSSNTGNGDQALYHNSTGSDNTAEGDAALYYNNTGEDNTSNGVQALFSNTGGNNNTAVGTLALYSNATGSYNTAGGNASLYYNTSGNYNSAFGEEAYFTSSNLSNTSCFGYRSGGVKNASNRIEIGNTSVSWIGGEVGWSTYSDARIKNSIKENVPGLAFINKLRPVTYHYNIHQANVIAKKGNAQEKDWEGKYDIEKMQMTGFIAQEVETAASETNYDFSGIDKPTDTSGLYSLRYSDFVVPLVKAVQELSKQNDSLKNEADNQKIVNAELEQRLAKLEALINVSNQSTVITSASLTQNIPNPFANSTTINYSLTQKFSSAKIIISDKNGNALKQFNLSAKRGLVTVDASTITSGAYQYSLYVDGKLADSKQMIISK